MPSIRLVVASPPPPHDHESLWRRYGAPICLGLRQAGLSVTNSHGMARHQAGADSPADLYWVTVWVPDAGRGLAVVEGVAGGLDAPPRSYVRARVAGRVITRPLE